MPSPGLAPPCFALCAIVSIAVCSFPSPMSPRSPLCCMSLKALSSQRWLHTTSMFTRWSGFTICQVSPAHEELSGRRYGFYSCGVFFLLLLLCSYLCSISFETGMLHSLGEKVIQKCPGNFLGGWTEPLPSSALIALSNRYMQVWFSGLTGLLKVKGQGGGEGPGARAGRVWW